MSAATADPWSEYWIDAWQRGVLFLDTLRQRGNIIAAQSQRAAPNVLEFGAELVIDGRGLKRPVNYGLVRIVPPEGTRTDPARPPVVVVDPRAGHGPGIGGMKQDSEIGVALAAGHACYFIGFLPAPVPGQTIEDVCEAEAAFIEHVADLHAGAEGKPIVIANCQAGWQIMMMAARRPDLAGPIMLAGSPLSYWAGVRGRNPLRYLGGILGGTWLTALAGDMGGGIFDGANLVANFEAMNLANTLWQKPYNVYSKVDTEPQRFLEFETWWGNPVLLNADEMQWIADNLFVGNKLSAGLLRAADGTRIDLRNIRSPIVVFCSWGDDITPPQQALGWITDLYDHEHDIIAGGQTIVYTMHQSIGHLGIFVSGKVAAKEHGEFVSCMDLIDTVPPGLYEAVITEVDADTANPALVNGRYLFRLEARSIAQLRDVIGNDPQDDARFAAAARLSDVNLGLYRTLAAPAVRAAVPPPVAEAMRALHPNRLRFSWFSDRNPLMAPVQAMAAHAEAGRRPVDPQNPFLALEHLTSNTIAASLKLWGEARDTMTEAMFLALYGSPVLQAAVGLGVPAAESRHHIAHDLARAEVQAQRRAELEHRFESGGIEEAVLRAVFYVRMPERAVDERSFTMLKLIRDSRPAEKRLSMARLKQMVREQFLLLMLDEDRALAALPRLLPPEPEARDGALAVVRRLLGARGALTAEDERRLARVEPLFGSNGEKPVRRAPRASARDSAP